MLLQRFKDILTTDQLIWGSQWSVVLLFFFFYLDKKVFTYFDMFQENLLSFSEMSSDDVVWNWNMS